ncbi:hypothetical protein CF70_031135 [Cupriavidus sp. SK-3]|uniref:hypothetical protein n=1 Tax=Cupriavidus sp. SK-3 TaxID=1470558 RepID=UPI00044B9501|nr:hypothetical protein [Cupriavidus sp. SK-3]KDP89458.1 hypothetical protein CF70_031135 [Cupriavidus sp. SK-3]
MANPGNASPDAISRHSVHSVLRERIVEHLFIGHALQSLWRRGVTDVEVLRAEFDAGGYDLVMSRRDVDRHIQFKTVLGSRRPKSVKASMKLMQKPSGCIICIGVPVDLDPDGLSYHWYGDRPGKPLPTIEHMPVAKHTKGDAAGVKGERSGHRVVPGSRFETLSSLEAVLVQLLGALP